MTDSDGHERFDALALGHVLGGLDPVDGARFRSHLVECRHCRLRVAELRSIASDLVVAEREERAAARVKTEVARREEEETGERRAWVPSRPGVMLGVAVLLAACVGLLLWNYHLRDVNRRLTAATENSQSVMSVLADGELLPVELGAGVRGVVAADVRHVAVDLAELPPLEAGEWVGVWLMQGGEVTDVRVVFPDQLVEDRLAASYEFGTADEIRVTVEEGAQQAAAPSGVLLLRADLR